MIYAIYKTTNIITGKFYIGKRVMSSLNETYLGSGKYLKAAISKYGRENFHREILYLCKDIKHMNTLEKILVVPDKEINYNIKPGGHGGTEKGRKRSLEHCLKISQSKIGKKRPPITEETRLKLKSPKPPRTKEHCINISKSKLGTKRGPPWNKGLTKFTDERINKYAESMKNK